MFASRAYASVWTERRDTLLAVGESGIVKVQGSVGLSDFSEPEPDLVILKPGDDFYENTAAESGDVLLC